MTLKSVSFWKHDICTNVHQTHDLDLYDWCSWVACWLNYRVKLGLLRLLSRLSQPAIKHSDGALFVRFFHVLHDQFTHFQVKIISCWLNRHAVRVQIGNDECSAWRPSNYTAASRKTDVTLQLASVRVVQRAADFHQVLVFRDIWTSSFPECRDISITLLITQFEMQL